MTLLGTKAWAVGELVTAGNMNAYLGPPPSIIDIDVFATPQANTGMDTISISSLFPNNAVKVQAAAAQNNSIEWDVLLAAGTWTLELGHGKNNTLGIFTVSLSTDASTYTDVASSPYNASASTIDGYAASASYVNRSTITGITIATTGRYRLRLKMATKHASSSGYASELWGLRLLRTA